MNKEDANPGVNDEITTSTFTHVSRLSRHRPEGLVKIESDTTLVAYGRIKMKLMNRAWQALMSRYVERNKSERSSKSKEGCARKWWAVQP
jgi:hypothetical protein